jgi:hypothetical protein
MIARLIAIALCLAAALPASAAQAQAPQAPTAFDCNSVVGISVGECQALVALYNGTNGPGWTNSTGWLASSTPCAWYGVTCVPGHVKVLDLGGNGLQGPLPAEIAGLNYLDALALQNNALSGGIPDLTAVTQIRVLDLFSNNLSGTIPSQLSQLSQLEYLTLDHNQFTGPIPVELGQLTKLVDLTLDNNQLSGPIPAQLGSLTQLGDLWLDNNQLNGSISPALGQMVKLHGLGIDHNQFTGPLPLVLMNLDELLVLHFDITSNCVPGNLDFLTWYSSIPDRTSGTNICDWRSLFMPILRR